MAGRAAEVEEGKKMSLVTYLAIFGVITLINAILARFGVIARPIGPGSSGLYISVAFMIAFALWFGGWGSCLCAARRLPNRGPVTPLCKTSAERLPTT